MYFFGTTGLISLLAGLVINTYLTFLWFMGQSIGGRPLLMLGVLLIILGIQFISTGFIANMIVDGSYRDQYSESHIRSIENVVVFNDEEMDKQCTMMEI
jgi:hypothetical protein